MNIRTDNGLNKCIISITQDKDIDSKEAIFEKRMIEENKIAMLLDINEKIENNQRVYEYDIFGMNSLYDYVRNEGINCKKLIKILSSIVKIKNIIADYFLTDGSLLVAPEYILHFPGSDDFYYVYVPGCEDAFSGSINKFAEFLLSNIDYSDEKVTDIIYKIYEDISCEKYYFEKYLLQLLNNENLNEYGKVEKKLAEDEINIAEVESGESCIKKQKNTIPFSILVMLLIIGILCICIYYSMKNRQFIDKKMISASAVIMSICITVVISVLLDEKDRRNRKKRMNTIKHMLEKE